MKNSFAKLILLSALTTSVLAFTSTQATERESIYAPLGKHIRDVKNVIDFDAKNCNSYSAGSGIGCMTRASGRGIDIIKIGRKSPCRQGGTVQLDFSNDFHLLAVTCGSNKELIDQFTKIMNINFGPGKSEGSKEEDYLLTKWSAGEITIKAAETTLGSDTIYKVTVFRLQ